jgi:hypothetical protein
LRPDQVEVTGNQFASDTAELLWDLNDKSRGVVTVNSRRSKAVIGFGGGRTFLLGEIGIAPSQGLQDGWCAITVTARDDAPAPRRWLITATGHAENTEMVWKFPDKSSVGRRWGKAPSVVEGVPARVSFPALAARVAAWSLDERGHRRQPMPVGSNAKSQAELAIGPQWKTLWYEVQINP